MPLTGIADVRKGPGDLWTGPDDDGDEFGRDVAAENVATRWEADGYAAEVLETLADSRSLMNWIAREAGIPDAYRLAFNRLDDLCTKADRAITDEHEALNAPEADPRGDEE